MKVSFRFGLIGLWIMALSTSAWATTGDGKFFKLLALVGEPESFAIMCEGNAHIEQGCLSFYLVDLETPEKPPFDYRGCSEVFGTENTRGPIICDESEEGLRHYLSRIQTTSGPGLANAKMQKLNGEDMLHYRWEAEEHLLVPPPELARFKPIVRVNSRVPAMGLYNASDLAGPEKGLGCSRRVNGKVKFLCPGCASSSREIDGWVYRTPVCEQPPRSSACDCTGTATVFRFVIVDQESGRRHLGNRIFVQPQDLLQHRESGTSDDNHAVPSLQVASVKAVVLSESILFFGSAVHAYWTNTTSFRLMAVVPLRSERMSQEESVESNGPSLDNGESPEFAATKALFCRIVPLANMCR